MKHRCLHCRHHQMKKATSAQSGKVRGRLMLSWGHDCGWIEHCWTQRLDTYWLSGQPRPLGQQNEPKVQWPMFVPSAHQVLARKWKEVYLSRRENKGSLVSQRRFCSSQQRPAQQWSLVWQWDDTRCTRPSLSCASIQSVMGLIILSHQKVLLGIKVQTKAVFLKRLSNKLKR